MSLTQERLNQVIAYDPETGLFRRIASAKPHLIGLIPRAHKTGRYRIRVDGCKYWSHRLAYLYMIGVWPNDGIDHANCDPGDNRWNNLRAATHSQNMANRKKWKVASSKHKGVHWDAAMQLWRAEITVNHKRVRLGRFKTEEAACAAYCAAAHKYFGEFARVA